jgi:hypothetical protein
LSGVFKTQVMIFEGVYLEQEQYLIRRLMIWH